MIRTVLIDDEPGAIESLEALLEKHCPEVEIVGQANNIHEGYEVITSNLPDLVFLDINMPKGSGLELVDRIKHLNVKVIFTTAHQEYAIKAVRLSAVDYLLKPISFLELLEAVDRYNRHTQKQNYSTNYGLLKDLMDKSKKLERIAVVDLQGVQVIETSNISHIEASKNYSIFHLLEGEDVVASKSMGEYEKLLDGSDFLRVSRSIIVNVSFIKRYLKKEGSVVLKDGQEVLVSNSRKDELLKLMTLVR